jgi:phosphoserine phosphatase
VAFRAKPVVAAAAAARVEHGDLTALLFAQGIRRADFVVPMLRADFMAPPISR